MNGQPPAAIDLQETLLRAATVLPHEGGKASKDASGRWKISASLWHDQQWRPSIGRDCKCAVDDVRTMWGKCSTPANNGVLAVTAEDVFLLSVQRYDPKTKKPHATEMMGFTIETDESGDRVGHADLPPEKLTPGLGYFCGW